MQGQKALRFVQKYIVYIYIYICDPKMNEGLTGFERHEAEELMTEFPFCDEQNLENLVFCAHQMHMEEPCFDFLRTKETLGSVIKCRLSDCLSMSKYFCYNTEELKLF